MPLALSSKEAFFAFFFEECAARSQGLRDCFAPFATQSREQGPKQSRVTEAFKVE
ncbi:MAG: hypothetical protein H7834_15345 [Magnetococcus sp. YQC-9]